MPAPDESIALSRRGLFGRGLARAVREGAALGSRLSIESSGLLEWADLEPDERELGAERWKDRVRQLFRAGDPAPLGRALAPAAAVVADACAVEPRVAMLDVGAGDGNLALEAASRGASVTACDLSQEQVERGRARTAGSGRTLDWVVADVESLPFEDERFDVVASAFGTVCAPRPRVAIAELLRVTRPGGVVALATWSAAGFMGAVLDLAVRHVGLPAGVERPSRWGRHDTLYREFLNGGVDIEWSELSLPLDPCALLALAGTELGEPERERLRAALRELAVPRTRDGRVAADYVVVTARVPAEGLR